MAGLIASALAGGIAGAGAAAGTALGRMQETEEKKSFELMRSELEMQRQTAIENLRATNAEKLAVGEQTRRREDAIDAATGRVGAATREAAGLTRREQFEFDTNQDNIKARAGAATLLARNTPQKLSPGEQLLLDGSVIGENKRQTGAEARMADLERRIAAGVGLGGGKGGGAGGKKLSPEATAEINDINEEEKGVQRAIDAATTEAAKTGGDASGGAFVSLQRRLEAVRLQKMRAFARHGIIDPVKDAEDVIAGGDIDEISRGMVQAQRLGAAYGKRFYDTVLESGVLQREQPGRAVPVPKEEPKRPAPRRETNPDDPRYKGLSPEERRSVDEAYFGKPIVERLRGIVSGSRGTGFYGDQFKD